MVELSLRHTLRFYQVYMNLLGHMLNITWWRRNDQIVAALKSMFIYWGIYSMCGALFVLFFFFF